MSMENKEKSFGAWIQDHKKQIIIGAGVVTVVAVSYVGLTHKDEVLDFFSDFIDSYKKTNNTFEIVKPIEERVDNKVASIASDVVADVEQKITHCPHDVNWHLRELPEGWNPSPEKVHEAIQKGIELPHGYTFVNAYSTGKLVA